MKQQGVSRVMAVSVLALSIGACSKDESRDQAQVAPPPPVAEALPPAPTPAEQFAASVVNIGGSQTNDAVKLVLAGDRFARGSGKFEAGDTIDAVAKLMSEHPDARVMIEGYTDDRGGNALNQRLSEQRARSVQAALTERGVDASRIEVAGRGSAQPVASNDTPDGRAQNRRVELTFAADGANRLAVAPSAPPGG